MPRISAGQPLSPDDSVITRVDISPEDIRKMSDEELHTLLAGIRNKRETSAPRAKSTRQGQPGARSVINEAEADTEEME